MHHEAAPSSEPVPHLDTPETTRECLDLVKIIDEYLERWLKYRHQDYIDTDTPNLAAYIVADTEELKDKEEDRTLKQQHQAKLSQWALLAALDTVPAHHIPLADYMKVVEVSAKSLHKQKEYITASRRLHRLLILREQLAVEIGRASNVNVTKFEQLATRLGNDFM